VYIQLQDLISQSEVVRTEGKPWTFERIDYYVRSPQPAEFIALDPMFVQMRRIFDEPLPLNLKVIGICPESEFFQIAVRSDCGIFWWLYAKLKFGMWKLSQILQYKMFRTLYLNGLLRYVPGETANWSQFCFDWKLAWYLITMVLSVIGVSLTLDSLWVILGILIPIIVADTALIRKRCRELVEIRDRELQEESVRALMQLYRISLSSEEFEDCVTGRNTFEAIRESRRVSDSADWNSECRYFTGNINLLCTVRPMGACENCGDFQHK